MSVSGPFPDGLLSRAKLNKLPQPSRLCKTTKRLTSGCLEKAPWPLSVVKPCRRRSSPALWQAKISKHRVVSARSLYALGNVTSRQFILLTPQKTVDSVDWYRRAEKIALEMAATQFGQGSLLQGRFDALCYNRDG